MERTTENQQRGLLKDVDWPAAAMTLAMIFVIGGLFYWLFV